ncbi:AAA family ATPase [Candidatus Falkowbacteria bacterium]|jgi:chromosome segregation protein|nr:AAA family ATPase [Candidatus Falkowbacteria bacterium]
MYLEKLEIQGFKSFANKNKLIFSGLVDGKKRGLTAIVGPNGSGKSNVADAIRWALGEQSMKTIRGKKSEDVIFSGSDKKGQLGMAEVSLYLNNSETAKNKTAAPETIEKESDLDQIILNCPEIIITRRIYRSGESEYLLNNNRVRLTDIQMLLAKANFGQKTYSVIGQGMVENFLNSSTTEKKDFFDEATGVKQFQIKRDAALNRLESSYENLQQVEMLLAEIKPRLRSLTRQIEKLKRRDEISQHLKTTQLNYYSFLWQDINQKLNKVNESFLDLEKNKIEKEKKLEKLNEDLNRIRATDNFREISELQPRLRELENQKNQLNKQLSKLQAELEIQLEAQGQFDVSWLNNKQEELKIELENITAEIAAINPTDTDREEIFLREELETINAEINRANNLRHQIDHLETEKYSYTKQISKLEAVLEANLEVQGQFDVSWLNNKNEELSTELKKLNNEITNLKSENNRDQEIATEKKLNSLQENLIRLNKELENLNKELRQDSKNEGQNEALSKLIDEFLKQLEEIEQETDLQQLKKLINVAKNDFQQKITKLINGLDDDKLKQIKKIQTEIISLNEDKQQTQEILNAERLRLSTINERLRLLEDRKSQTEKEIADIKAKLEKAQVKFDASEIEAEKRELTKKIEALEKEQANLQINLRLEEWLEKKQLITNKINDCRLKASTLAERVRLLNTKKLQTEKEIADIKAKLEKAQVKFDASEIEAEKELINKRLASLNEEIKNIEIKLVEFNTAQEKEKGLMYECQKNIQSLQQEINTILAELNNLRVEAARQETKLEDLEANIRNDELEINDIRDYKITTTDIAINRWQKEIANSKLQLEQIGGIDPETEKEFAETKERYDFLTNQTTDLHQAIKSLEEIIYELDSNIKSRFDVEFKVISEKFNEYFKVLFNGGSAKISKIMIDESEEDKQKATEHNENGHHAHLEGLSAADAETKKANDEKLKRIKFLRKHNAVGLAGIDIQATPPGKKIQTVSMLSGGERALTAIALICAIISANPSPFVVLDEADAALDEANSERLAKILDDLSNKTQFIVITHNRASMRRASILYGVTMEENGVSKLLSVKLDDLKNKNIF